MTPDVTDLLTKVTERNSALALILRTEEEESRPLKRRHELTAAPATATAAAQTKEAES